MKNLTIVGGSVSSEGDSVGGIVGYNEGTVENCTNSATVSGSNNVGGIVGHNTKIVENCANSGKVSGSYYVGGIVGNNTWTVQNCTNSAAVSESQYTGIIVGFNNGTVQNCGYLKNADENINSNLNAIGWTGGGSSTSLVSFSSEDEMAQIAVNLSASIDKTDLALGSTDTATITLVPAPGTLEDVYNVGVKNVSVTNGNTDVITIYNNYDGTVTVEQTGTASGTAEITVTADLHKYNFSDSEYSSTEYETITFKFYVSVSNVPLESISIPETEEVQAGKTTTLEVTYTPKNATNKTVTWTSDNTEVATVDKDTGVVTGVSVGKATITATPEDTSNGASAQTCEVTVTEAETEAPETPDDEETGSGSSGGGGCNAGTGALALLALIPLALRRKR